MSGSCQGLAATGQGSAHPAERFRATRGRCLRWTRCRLGRGLDDLDDHVEQRLPMAVLSLALAGRAACSAYRYGAGAG